MICILKRLDLLTSLIIFALLNSGCSKSVAEGEGSPMEFSASTTRTQPQTALILIPAPRAVSVDVNAKISVRCNMSIYAHKMSLSLFRVTREKNEPVKGKYVYTDTVAEFIPDEEFEYATEYNVQIDGTVFKQIDSETEEIREQVEQEWSFVTDSSSNFVMRRTNPWVTASARDGCRMVQFGDYLYLYGGWTGSDSSSTSHKDIYRSTGDLSVWEQMPDAPWQGRHTFGLGVVNNEVIVYGGDQNTTYFDVWKSQDGVQFNPVRQDLDSSVRSRLIYGSTTHRGKLYILGGQRTLDLHSGMSDVWTSPNGFGWRKLTGTAHFLAKNITGAVTSFNGRIWVIGGGYYGHPDNEVRWTNHVYSSEDGISWVKEPDAPWSGRQFADVCVWDNKLWMVGGHNGRNLSEIWYMKKDGSWHQYEPSPLFVPRHASAVATYNDKLVIVCGDQNNECWVIEKAD